jgi:hypothetical protein
MKKKVRSRFITVCNLVVLRDARDTQTIHNRYYLSLLRFVTVTNDNSYETCGRDDDGEKHQITNGIIHTSY